jgi:hypothetical protein
MSNEQEEMDTNRATPSVPLALLLLLALRLPSRLVPLDLLNLLLLRALRIPLPSLQHQHAYQHQRKNRIASRIHPQRVFPGDIIFAFAQLHYLARGLRLLQISIHARSNNPESFDDVRQIHGNAGHVQNERRAVEEHVGFAGFEELDQEAEQAGADYNVQDARDDSGGCVEEFDVGFEEVEVFFAARFGLRPEDVVVIGEVGEEDA